MKKLFLMLLLMTMLNWSQVGIANEGSSKVDEQNQLREAYCRTVVTRLRRAFGAPRSATAQEFAVLRFTLTKYGERKEIQILQSSASRDFVKGAEDAVRLASQRSFPSQFSNSSLTIESTFRNDGVSVKVIEWNLTDPRPIS